MVFSSFIFVFGFLPLLILAYFLSPKKIRNYTLLVFNLGFYFWSGPRYALILLVTVVINYFLAILIDKNRKRFVLFFAVFANITLLFYFKYFNFFLATINKLLSAKFNSLDIILPVGISFYIFQIVSYLIDVYRKEAAVQTNPLKLLLYVSLFPQIMAGPIVRYKDITKELDNRNPNLDDFAAGIERFIYGLAKKMIFANHLGQLADIIFGLTELTTDLAWLGVFSYTLQIYFDFSAYSDMALGLANMLGFHYPENFNYPYIAKTITEFWRRWHISLSMWFRDYVYIPLGGNRKRQVLNLAVVWLLTGLWHGASLNFIVWGVYFLVFLLIEKFVLKIEKVPVINHIYTLLVVMVSWVIFRTANLPTCFHYLKIMFVPTFTNFDWLKIYIQTYYIYLIGAAVLATPIYPWILEKIKNVFFINVLKYLCLIILFIVTLAFMTRSTYNAFIYFAF